MCIAQCVIRARHYAAFSSSGPAPTDSVNSVNAVLVAVNGLRTVNVTWIVSLLFALFVCLFCLFVQLHRHFRQRQSLSKLIIVQSILV